MGDTHSSRPKSENDESDRDTRFNGQSEECGLHTEGIEDDDLEVEIATQDLLDKLTKLSGEDLASLLEHGYGELKDRNTGVVQPESYVWVGFY